MERDAAGAPDVHSAIDRLEQGLYAPVELLLLLGRLRYGDYEAWRRGEVATLESALADEAPALVALLDEAISHAARGGQVLQSRMHAGIRDRGAPSESRARASMGRRRRCRTSLSS